MDDTVWALRWPEFKKFVATISRTLGKKAGMEIEVRFYTVVAMPTLFVWFRMQTKIADLKDSRNEVNSGGQECSSLNSVKMIYELH